MNVSGLSPRALLARLASRRPRLQLFGVGTAKSGTSSLAALFARDFRAAHEPDAAALIALARARAAGASSHEETVRALRARASKRALDVDVSHVNGLLIEDLVRGFPAARFILTIRDCRSWLASMLEASLRSDPPLWRPLKELRFARPGTAHPPEEAALAARGLYTLDGYLGHWARHNACVLAAVPPERLLVVRTDRLGASLSAIAEFSGIRASQLDARRSHENRASLREDILDAVPRAHLRRVEERHCTELMARFFPDVALD